MACGGAGWSYHQQRVRYNPPPALAEQPAGLPNGRYKLVGWDLVNTGMKLIDEICQISAYLPSKPSFSRYIMPYGEPRPAVSRRYNIRVVTVGRLRMLKEFRSHKLLRTGPERRVLTKFVVWLESVKADGEMIILMYHEPRRLSTITLIQALMRNNLLERFKKSVAGFTDSFALSAVECRDTFKSISLRILAKLLLDEGSQRVGRGLERAMATYNIIETLANQSCELDDLYPSRHLRAPAGTSVSISPKKAMIELAIKYARPVATEIEALEQQKDLVARQNTFRAVFRPLLRCPRRDRMRLIQLRRVLAEAGLLHEQLKDAWHDGRRDGLANVLTVVEDALTQDDIDELVDIFDCHFDPRKRPYYPPSRMLRTVQQLRVETPDELNLSSDSDSTGLASSCGGAGYDLLEEDVYLDF